ncbi:MAG: hypothetical protein SGARI_007223 [Bacillariaceae sp.]
MTMAEDANVLAVSPSKLATPAEDIQKNEPVFSPPPLKRRKLELAKDEDEESKPNGGGGNLALCLRHCRGSSSSASGSFCEATQTKAAATATSACARSGYVLCRPSASWRQGATRDECTIRRAEP